jgi:hypothetical protein
MRRLLLACFVLGLIGAASAATRDELAAPIHQIVDSINKGDVAGAAAVLAEAGVVIIDEVPPYVWHGPAAFKIWADDLAANDAAQGITDEKVTLGKMTRMESTGDLAYVIVDAVYTFAQHGKAMREPGQMTFALHKSSQGWRISAWTWTGPTPTPAM